MKTVLGFDSWTGGAHNFERLVPAFRERGFELILLHIGSWSGEVERPSEETIGNLKVKDVSFYAGKNISSILDTINPVAVLFLSNDVFAHRAFNRYCEIRNIPTLRLYHGLVEIQATGGDRIYKVNLISQFMFVLRRIPKALNKIWPLYAHALYKSNAEVKEWIRFISDIFKQAFGLYISTAAADCKTTACAVYTQVDVSHAIGKYGYAEHDVHVVGNPDLIRFNLETKFLGLACSISREACNEIIYIDTGLIYAGMVFIDANDYLSHLKDLKEILAKQGLRLAVKLHPDHFRTDLPGEISSIGIRVVENRDFVQSLLECRAAMVEPSTAALIPALLGLPLLLVAFGKMQHQKYGKVLMDYPRSTLVTDSQMVASAITNIENSDRSGVDAWIKRNSGPLPADKMPERVAEIVNRLVGH